MNGYLPFSLGGGNGSKCPLRDLAGGLGAGRVGWEAAIRKRCSETAVKPQNSGFPPCVPRITPSAIVMVVITGRGDRDDRVNCRRRRRTSVPAAGCRHGPLQRRTQSSWLLSYHRPRCGVAMPDRGRQGVNTGSGQSLPPGTLSSDSIGELFVQV